jgi:hypothetical protein
MHPMQGSSVDIRANRVLESLTSVIVFVYVMSAGIAVLRLLVLLFIWFVQQLWRRSLQISLVWPQCENAELRGSYKQYILCTRSNIKGNFLEAKQFHLLSILMIHFHNINFKITLLSPSHLEYCCFLWGIPTKKRAYYLFPPILVGWSTMLQAGRSQVRFPMSLDFSIDLILPATL